MEEKEIKVEKHLNMVRLLTILGFVIIICAFIWIMIGYPDFPIVFMYVIVVSTIIYLYYFKWFGNYIKIVKEFPNDSDKTKKLIDKLSNRFILFLITEIAGVYMILILLY